MTHINYARIPGPGDLSSPPEEPMFGWDDAAGNVALALQKDGHVADIVDALSSAWPLIAIMGNHDVPVAYQHEYRALLSVARMLHDRVEDEFNALNGI